MPQDATLIVDCRATLGEGLTWHAASGAWLWTDIEGRRLWRHEPARQVTQSCEVPDRVGAFVVARSGRLLLALAKQLAWAEVDWRTGRARITPIVAVEDDQPATRTNDGRTDRQGNFVFGTMNETDGHPATGHLYQYSTAHGLRRLNVEPVGIANSICFSPDGRTIYFCDSMQGRIMRGEYDAERAQVSRVAPFATIAADHGMPDGSVVDAEGGLWNAQWGGSAVRRYDAGGRHVATGPLPVAHVTCPAFGGPHLDILCTTTARMGVSEGHLDACPETGGLFMVDAGGARGLPEREFQD